MEECWDILKRDWRCFNCLDDDHAAGECSLPSQCSCGRGRNHSPSICRDRSNVGRGRSHAHVASQSMRGRGRGRARGRGFNRESHNTISDLGDKGDQSQNTEGSVAEGGTHTLSADAQVFQPTSQPSRGRGRGRGGRRGAYFCQGAWGAIFLQTAHVQVRNPVNGNIRKGRLILDTACHDSYILESTSKDLRCRPVGWKDINVEVFGTDKAVAHRSAVVKVEILCGQGKAIPLELFTIERLCGTIPGNKLSGEALRQIQGYHLADPEAVHEGELAVHILVGLDQYWNIVGSKVCQSGFGPRLLDTRVGWVLSGAVNSYHRSRPSPAHCYLNIVSRPGLMEMQVEESLDDIVHRFWDLDTVGVKEEEVSPVIAHFESTVRFDADQSRMEVKVPWRKSLMPYLPDNFKNSLLQENLLQKKLALPKNAELKRKYTETIQKHLDDKVVELVPVEEDHSFCNNQVGAFDYNNSVIGTSDEQNRVISYVPHHGVQKKGKVRIVFNASSQAYPGALSLNDCIHSGPSLLADLVDVLLRFRTYEVALVGDITGAFHMLSLAVTDRDAFRFLWHRDGKLEKYRFCRVPFGCTVSPFLLNCTVRVHLKEALKDQPELFDLIISALYVDDLLGGGDSVEAVLKLKEILERILRIISMEWHGWMSNSAEVRRELSIDDVEEQSVLGLKWQPERDTLSINWSKLESSFEDPKYKRDLLSGTASMWDPLGVYLPVLLALKLMFQSLCKSKCGWKGRLPSDMRDAVEEWKSQLYCLKDTVIPRFALLQGYDYLELHGFADASLQAYGAVVYVRCVRGADVDCNFVMARNRVAPLKGQSLQRLELMGALLLCRLMKKVLESLSSLKISRRTYYVDSRDVLCWIKSRNIRWSPFIENRVTEVHQSTETTMWRHVSTELNPADTLTRPVAAVQFVENKAWFKGPEFLYSGGPSSQLNSEEFEQSPAVQGEIRKIVKVAVRTPPTYQFIDLDRFGTYFKLISTTVLVLKFLFYGKREVWLKRMTNKYDDYMHYARAALKYWVRVEQLAYYPQEVAHCPVGAYVSKVGVNSTRLMRSFRLFKDQEGLLRVSSRIQNSILPWEAQNPVLLSPESKFTRLYVEMIHRVSLHVGYRQTLANIRRQYFIPRGRRLVRSVIHKCVVCLKAEGPFYPTLASPPLPDFRLCPVDPFTNCGVDFAGPVKIKEPGRQVKKGYIMLLTCASTRAVCLELLLGPTVEDMTLGFRRFCARMNSVPELMISDNAATFKRAAKELEEVFASPKMQQYLDGKGIKWQFYLQRCPWWGGFIEKMVMSVKKPLRKVVGDAYLSYVEFNTILLEIESLINARPITWDYDDPNEPGPIAPSDLLHGRPFRQFPPMHEVKVDGKLPQMCKGRLRYLEKLKTHWWDAWQNEYLKELQVKHSQRHVGNKSREAKAGDVVLIRNKCVPRGQWKLGIISEVKPGPDNVVRTAKVELVSPGRKRKNATGYKRSWLNRSPTHLVPLEMNIDSD